VKVQHVAVCTTRDYKVFIKLGMPVGTPRVMPCDVKPCHVVEKKIVICEENIEKINGV